MYFYIFIQNMFLHIYTKYCIFTYLYKIYIYTQYLYTKIIYKQYLYLYTNFINKFKNSYSCDCSV